MSALPSYILSFSTTYAILDAGAAVPAVGGYSHRSHRGEVVLMVTYSELFQLLMLLVAFAGLIIQICKRK